MQLDTVYDVRWIVKCGWCAQVHNAIHKESTTVPPVKAL